MERFRTTLDSVPLVPGLSRNDGWVDMKVQFLLDKHNIGSDDFLLGWTVLPPGAKHDRHRHHEADEFFIVLHGSGTIYTNDGEEPSSKGDVIFTPRGDWHGFHNTGEGDVVLVWGWSGAGTLEDTGYETDSSS